MTGPGDPNADDLFLDRLLAEAIGGDRPADRVARILRADAEDRALAAARVDAAAATAAVDDGAPAPSLVPARRRLARLALAATVLVGLGAALVWTLRPGLTVNQRATAWIDEFHRVMPAEPPVLRDPARRAQLAPKAIPVLREVERFFASLPAELPWRARAPEFVVYALVLGDTETRTRIDAEVRAGRAGSELLLATAAAITAADAAERAGALDRVAAGLRTPPDVAASAVHCLVTAGDLSADEARRLAAATADEDLARRFRVAAELADSDPRRLLGQPFELSGRLHTGAELSTGSLRGKVVVVFFWASWCAPCTRVLPDVVAAARRHADRDLAVVGVSCDHDSDELTRFLEAHPEVDWPQLFDGSRPGWHELAFWSGVRTVPRLFLIDRRGILREVNARDGLDRLVEKLLAEPR